MIYILIELLAINQGVSLRYESLPVGCLSAMTHYPVGTWGTNCLLSYTHAHEIYTYIYLTLTREVRCVDNSL